ncbi:MAG: efflux RND transporter periplasmic adaptor subunit [Bryobacteraceae bacterium]
MYKGTLILFLAIVICGCTGPYSNTEVAAKGGNTVPVHVFRTTLETIPEVITANGELLAEEMATIGARISGRAAKLPVDLGSKVQAGQVLAEIQRDDYEFRVRQANALVNQTRAQLGILDRSNDDVVPGNTAIVKQAEAALQEARLVYDTSAQLNKEGVLSRFEYDKARVRREAAEAASQSAIAQVMQLQALLSQRRAELALAQQNLDDCTVRAPFSGSVTKRQASLGEYLAVNSPIVTIVRQNPIRLRLEIPERVASRVRMGQAVDVHLQGVKINRTGRVVRISPAIDAQSRSLTLEAEIPNEDSFLRPGSFAEASITVDSGAQGLAIPSEAVQVFAGTERVFVVKGDSLDDRIIKTGRHLPGERLEVVAGLEPGLAVVRKAEDRYTKGQKVRVE